MNQISATRREMVSSVGSLPEIQNVPIYSAAVHISERRSEKLEIRCEPSCL